MSANIIIFVIAFIGLILSLSLKDSKWNKPFYLPVANWKSGNKFQPKNLFAVALPIVLIGLMIFLAMIILQ